jgi:hypothetical protein
MSVMKVSLSGQVTSSTVAGAINIGHSRQGQLHCEFE